jgi:hypothetical protein
LRRSSNADTFCDIEAEAIDDFYYENLGLDSNSPDAKRLFEIFDKLTQLLRDQKRSRIIGHEAIHLVLLVDTLFDDYARTWEGALRQPSITSVTNLLWGRKRKTTRIQASIGLKNRLSTFQFLLRRHFEVAICVANKTANASVFIPNREVNLPAGDVDLEPGRVLLGYAQLGHFVCERKLGKRKLRSNADHARKGVMRHRFT